MKYFFVSSTFSDMQVERDALHSVVMPSLSRIAKENGDDVCFRDLRWGINTSNMTEDLANVRVLESCVNEIDRCKPFFLVLLGERYGSCFNTKHISNVAQRHGYTRLPRSIERESVTEFEIEYGALSDPETMKNTIFMFRDPIEGAPDSYLINGNTEEEKEENRRLLAELKEKILVASEKYGARVIRYSLFWNAEQNRLDGIEGFIEKVTSEVSRILAPFWDKNENLSKNQLETLLNKYAVKSADRLCVGRTELAKKCADKLESGNISLKIAGDTGSGKSVLFARIVTDLQERGIRVIPCVFRSSSTTCDGADMMRQWAWHVDSLIAQSLAGDETASLLYDMDMFRKVTEGLDKVVEGTKYDCRSSDNAYDRYDYYAERLTDLLKKYNQIGKERIVLACDSFGIDSYASFKTLEEYKSDKISFLFTYRRERDEFEYRITPSDYVYLGNHPLSARVVIESSLRELSKELHPDVITKILKSHDSKDPVFLSLIIQRLTIMDADDFKNVREDDLDLDPATRAQLVLLDSLPKTQAGMLRELVKEAAQRFGQKQIEGIFNLLCLLKTGIKREHISRIVCTAVGHWDEETASRMINLLPSVFIEYADSTVDFKTVSVRQSVCEGVSLDYELAKVAFEYISELDISDESKINNYFALFELCVKHLAEVGDFEKARKYVNSAFYVLTESVGYSDWDYDSQRHAMACVSSACASLWRAQGCVDSDHFKRFGMFDYRVKMYEMFGIYMDLHACVIEMLDNAADTVISCGCASDYLTDDLEETIILTVNTTYNEQIHGRLAANYAMVYYKKALSNPTNRDRYIKTALTLAERAEKLLKKVKRYDVSYRWYKMLILSVKGELYELAGDVKKAQKLHRLALSTPKLRLERVYGSGFAIRCGLGQNLVRMMWDTVPAFSEITKWVFIYESTDSHLFDTKDPYVLRENALDDLKTARCYELAGNKGAAARLYRSAVEKAEIAVAQNNPKSADRDLWVLAESRASYIACLLKTLNRSGSDVMLVEDLTQSREDLEVLREKYGFMVFDALAATILCTAALCPDNLMDRDELLREAESIFEKIVARSSHKFFVKAKRICRTAADQLKQKGR